MENSLLGLGGFAVALLVAIPLGVVAGYLYSLLLNRVAGQEMMVGTYVGFSIVAGMCIFWLMAPFKNPALIWPVGGQGLRVTLTLADTFGGTLNNFLNVKLFGYDSTGLLLFYAHWPFCCGCSCEQARVAMEGWDAISLPLLRPISMSSQCGNYPVHCFLVVGYVVYAQSFGFAQLYNGPLMTAFPPWLRYDWRGFHQEAKVRHAVIGVVLFQTLLTVVCR